MRYENNFVQTEFSREDIERYLQALDEELASKDTCSEITLCGGALMSLVYSARPLTRDIDALYVTSDVLKECIYIVAEKYNLVDDWLNNAVRVYVHKQVDFFKDRVCYKDFGHLAVYRTSVEYMLAMKLFAFRLTVKSVDRCDIDTLLKEYQKNVEVSKMSLLAMVVGYFGDNCLSEPALEYIALLSIPDGV